jgi:hypothetical protein
MNIVYINNHTYIISNDKIEKNDYYLNTIQNIVYKNDIEHYNVDKDYLKKIIATTDTTLRSNGTIIIHKVQEVFTKEDMLNAYEAGRTFEAPFKKEYFETWFEQNY